MTTVAEIRGWRWGMAIHGDARDRAIWMRTCQDEPRVAMIDTLYRREQRTERVWIVDDETECRTLEEVAAALNAPAEGPEVA